MLELQQVIGWTAACVVLLALLLVLLAGPARRKIRLVLLYVGLFLALHVTAELVPETSPLHRILGLLGLFLAVSAVGYSGFLLLTQSRLSHTFVRPLPQIFLDVVHCIVYVAALFVTLGTAGIDPASLFTGSAILTAVIGLSLRDTLGNLLAGIAIEAQRPFTLGDWIQFNNDPNQIGQVTEINWRATKVVTRDRIEIVVPNAQLAQFPIINYSRPEPFLRSVVTVYVALDVPPLRAKRVILDVVKDTPGVLPEPLPAVDTGGIEDRGLRLNISAYVTDFLTRERIESALRDRIWYALRRHGMTVGGARVEARIRRDEEERVARQEQGLCCVDFLRQLPNEARRELAARAQTHLYAEGELIIRQGDTTTELFIIESGEVAILAARPGEAPIEVGRLGRGDFFGEMAALTGEARSASVRATKECAVLVLDKAALAGLFAGSPEMAAQVSRVVSNRQAGTDAKLSAHVVRITHEETAQNDHLLERIRAFFSI